MTTTTQHPLLLAVAGTPEFHLGFELAGVKTFITLPERDPAAVFRTLQHATQRRDIGILIVEEELLSTIPTVERVLLENNVKPVLVTLRREPTDSGLLRRQIMRAIGVDLLAPERNAEEEY